MSAGGRAPTEPTGPSAGRPLQWPWVISWLVVATVTTAVLAIAWIGSAGVEVLGSLGAMVALAVSVVLHHVVVTQDNGERTAPRPDPPPPGLSPQRRRLVGLILGGAVLVGVAGVFGLVWFGPRPPTGTAWRRGVRLTTIDGSHVRPVDVPLGGVVTVWPQDAVATERAAAMLIRLREAPEPPTRLADVVDTTLVAYSRLCTHAGCAVALYRDRDQALFCPCHQATFDARRGAVPTAGPASHPLPQLPLDLDDDGFVVAAGGFTARPGAVGGSA